MYGGASFAKRFAQAKEAERRAGFSPAKVSPRVGAGFKSFAQIPREKIQHSITKTGEGSSSHSGLKGGKKSSQGLVQNRHEKLQHYLEDAVRPSTKKTYRSYWRRYNEFCARNSLSIQEAESISLFLVDLAEKTENRTSPLSAKHAIKYFMKLRYPFKKCKTDTYFVARIVKSISQKWGKPVKKAKTISSELVAKLIPALLKSGSFKDHRTAIFILVQFICMARFEEVAKLEKQFIEVVPPGNLKILFPSAKNYNVWDAKTCWAAGNTGGFIDPVSLIQDYLKKLSSQVTWLFPSFRIGKEQSMIFLNKPISYNNMLSLLREALSSIGEKGEEFSLHSIRTGSLSEVANSDRNVPRSDIMRHGRWKSLQMVDHYHELLLAKKLAPSKALKIYDI